MRNVGIQGDTIVRISAEPLAGKRIVDAGGLVVSPGFIELHQHAFLPETYPLLALDGVTTALELEVGASDFTPFLQAQDGRALIHYGASASLLSARLIAWDIPVPPSRFGAGAGIIPKSGPATNDAATSDRLSVLLARLQGEVEAGALGVGIGLEYGRARRGTN